VAEEEGVSFYRVDKASRVRGEHLEATRTLDPPTRLNIDEQSHLRGQVYNTAVSDPDERRVLELIETRKRKPLQDFLASLPAATRKAIKEVCIDMHQPYRDAVRSALPHAALIRCDLNPASAWPPACISVLPHTPWRHTRPFLLSGDPPHNRFSATNSR
jgi:hypothetical protein